MKTIENIRKVAFFSETTNIESLQTLKAPITRIVGMFVLPNPFAGGFSQDLSELFEAGREVGEHYAPILAKRLGAPVVTYGKAAVVGTAGELEHGGACMHPMLGKPMRAAIGGGKAVIPSNVKVGAPGTAIDIPLSHKDDSWALDYCDTITASMPDAPRADEIVLMVVFGDGGRPLPRC
ncbi:amino acid synthesis family protein [Vibrio parahaemolyticus]|uniref:amino acid synthesis family protein n=1 Tax=Vibrio mediterranei TaxID=689 RepID=UPI004067B54E